MNSELAPNKAVKRTCRTPALVFRVPPCAAVRLPPTLGTLMGRTLILLLLAATLVPVVEARTIIAPSKQKSRSLATVVAEVEITKITPLMVGAEQCAFEYEGKVFSVKKGRLPREAPFRFGVLGGLAVGKRYVLYLRNLPTKSEFVRVMEERNADFDGARSLFEHCPLFTPVPMFFRADRVSGRFGAMLNNTLVYQ